MLLFGMGTWPAVFGGGLIGAQVWRVTASRRLNAAAGALLFAFSLLTLLAPLRHLHP